MKYDNQYVNDCDSVIGNIPQLDKLKNKRILITGATGMICSSVAELLFRLNSDPEYNLEIFLAGRNEQNLEKRFENLNSMPGYNCNYTFLQYDACKSEGFLADNKDIKFDYIIHGAGYGDPRMISGMPVDIMLSNVCGTEYLLKLAKRCDARFLMISSGEVYGKVNSEELENGLYSENDYGYIDFLNPRAVYPQSKRTAENLCIAYNRQYGVDSVIARSCHVYGPTISEKDSRASAQFIRKAAAGENVIMKSAGNQRRSYCYTLDCASAILTILINGNTCEAYNISNKNSLVSIRELAEEAADRGKVELIFENPSDAELKSYNMMENSCLDASKLETLGWKAEFDLKAGIKRTLDLLRE